MTHAFDSVQPADAGRATSSGLALRTWNDLDAALGEWRSLEARLTDVPMASSHLWTASWLRVYRDLIPSTILTADLNGQTVAACLVTRGVEQRSGPIPIRTLHIGTAGEPLGQSVCVEYNGLLAERAHREGFIAAVQTWLKSQRGVDECRLDGWPVEELNSWTFGSPASEVRRRDCKFFDLTKAQDVKLEPIELLGRSTRQNLRRLLRKYEAIDCRWAETLDEADEIFTELTSLHQARWNAMGQPGAFASSRFEAFQRQLLVQGFTEQKVVLFRARHEGQSIGCLMLLVDRGRMLDYLSGFAPFDQKPSPGLVTHFLCLTEATRRGYGAYDFLVGEKRHKDNLSTDVQELAWATWRRGTVRNLAIDGLRAVKTVTERWRKPKGTGAAAEVVQQAIENNT